MKASTLLVSLGSILILSACGDDASLGKAGTPVETGSGGSAGSDPGGSGSTGGSTSSSTTTGGSTTSGGTGGATSSGGTGGSTSGGTGGATSSGGTGGAPAGDAGADPCAQVSCKAGTHCILEEVVCIQAPCPPQPTCVPDAPPGSDCSVDQDCRLFDNYCGGCACDALPAKASNPKCSQGMVQCLVQPCRNKTAACSNGKCVASPL